jgi:hypothetical protein
LQGELSRADRRLLIGAGALAILVAAATIAFAPANGLESTVPSSYDSGSGGARAAYLLLEQLRYPVRRWEESPLRLRATGSHAVLILAEPTDLPENAERTALLRFVRNGGRVLFCGERLGRFFAGANLSDPEPGQEWRQFSSDLPSPFTRGAIRISMEPRTWWKQLGVSQLGLYGGDQPVAVSWRMGKGELLWWAAATPLTNAGLDKADNLALFLDAVSTAGGEPQREIYWDEYFHGQRRSLWSYIGGTPVTWGLLQFGIICAAILFTFSRRWGPVIAPRVESRLSPLEFVDTLGALYESAGASSVPAGVGYRHLRLALTHRLRLPVGIPDAELARAAGERLGWDAAHFSATLQKAAEAQSRKYRAGEVLPVAQDMARYTGRLVDYRRNRENR